jgi:hypothetical protein
VLATFALAAVWLWAVFRAFAQTGGWVLAFRIAAGASVAILLLAITLSSMTIVVREDSLVWWLGLGWPRGRLPLEALTDASATHASLWRSWSLHVARPGGLNAVRLRTVHKRSLVLRTDRPQELLDAIARARFAGAA